ncbi:MAG TPA: DUF885 family protein [Candidatus Nanoarchaeia archaeon]|nr:DUF885 family protein [Candidatus Nanoarchaeia archaeon]
MSDQKRDFVIESLIADFNVFFSETSDERLALGLTHDIGSLSTATDEEHQETIKQGQNLLARLQRFSKNGLPFDQSLDLELAALHLENYLFFGTHTYNGKPLHKVLPDAADTAHGFFILLTNDPRPNNERFDDITCRLQDLPKYLSGALRVLDTPVQRWVDIEIEAITHLPLLLDGIKTEAEGADYKGLSRLERASNKAKQAITDYIAQLQKMRTTPAFFLGVEQAKEQVRVRGIDLSFEEMQTIAREYLVENSHQLEDLRHRLVEKYSLPKETIVDELHHFLNKKYAVPLEKILATYHQEQDKIIEFIAKHRLFQIPSQQEMNIIQTPKFFEPMIPAGAIDVPLPFRERKKSFIYLTLGSKVVDEHTRLKIPVMMIHEGIPGHHLHYTSAFGNPSSVRKHWGEAMDLAEGWTTMLEEYMLDQGYMGDLTDEARFCGKIELRRLGARVAIDLYFMTGEKDYLDVGLDVDVSSNNPFVNAGKVLRKATAFTPQRIKAELNFYSQTAGYPLSYLIGNRLVWKLKEDFAAAQQGKLSGLDLDRKFHGAYLQAGCMPLKYLRRVFEHHGYLPSREK